MNRRRFLQTLAATSTAPLWLRYADDAVAADGRVRTRGGGLLLVVFLRGGNDPLNTVSPYLDSTYQRMRPNLRLRESEVLPMGNGYGLHAALPNFKQFWQAGQLAIVQQVGIGRPDFSHSSATMSCETANADRRFETGWLGRYLDATSPRGPVRAAGLGEAVPRTLAGAQTPGLVMESINDFAFADAAFADAQLRHGALISFTQGTATAGSMRAAVMKSQIQMVDAVDPVTRVRARYDSNGHVPTPGETIGQLFAAGIGTEIGYITLGGFDTHTDQRTLQAKRLAELDGVAKDFFATANQLGVAGNSAMLVVSEFGRRVYDNRSYGTDHGAATNVYLIGPRVKGGMYGPKLDLSSLDDGNLPVRVDLRSVYASVLEQWMNTSHREILGGRFATIPLFA